MATVKDRYDSGYVKKTIAASDMIVTDSAVQAAWSSATTYALNDLAVSSGTVYRSLQAANLNNAVTDTAWWESLGDGSVNATNVSSVSSFSDLNGSLLYSKISGIPSSSSPLSITSGGTGANTAAGALTSLGAVAALTDSTITTTTTLDSTAFGKRFVVTGSTTYTITLPAVSGNGGKRIEFIFQPTVGYYVIVRGNSTERVNGLPYASGKRAYVYGEKAEYYCTGTEWMCVEALSEQSIITSGISDTSISAGVDTTILFSTGTTRGSNTYASGTGLFSFNAPGTYDYRASVWLSSYTSVTAVKVEPFTGLVEKKAPSDYMVFGLGKSFNVSTVGTTITAMLINVTSATATLRSATTASLRRATNIIN